MKLFNLVPHSKYPEFYSICKNTGAHFFKPAKTREYKDSYFLDEFKAQYNKTYYEDEPNLRNLAVKRLSILQKFLDPNGKKLLELGSAAGFFLSEAKKIGYIPKGVEISSTEVEYARSLGLNVEKISFLEFSTDEKFDIICAFFVIEHFPDQEIIFEKIFSLLAPGGFVFLAIPSLYGPSYLTNPENWFENHPSDHFVDYSPKSLEKIFQKFQSQIVFRGPMSYHPGRDLGWRGKFPAKYFYRILADMDCYGDTIQILARLDRK
ncbi:MAG: class I SAM-dependent methyltransferase [Leptospiraceae bacterium]|nr:class I SAM-dependent methyltransferase [Leptospiraceae bacterium]